MTVTTIDIAKNVFAVHGVEHNGEVCLVKSSGSRTALPALIAALPPA